VAALNPIWQHAGLVFDQPVRDPLWRNIMVPKTFLPLINSTEFVKLGRILQLGPAHLVYPGATHTRRAHSFGVFDLAKRLLEALSSHHAELELDAVSIRSFLVAALCHDLGHFPYTHSLKELPLKEHEALSADLMVGRLADFVYQAGAEPQLAAAIVDPDRMFTHPDLAFLQSLLSGVLDPDKLDYLNRDAWACGVPYGTQDVDFILNHVGLTADRKLGIDERGIMSIEAVLFSKYQMYRAVYWHRMVRSATAMIKKAVLAGLQDGRISANSLYGLDDAGFYSLMATADHDPSGLIRSVHEGQLYTPVFEQSFQVSSSAHQRLLDLSARQKAELELEALLSAAGKPVRLVIDVPEPISFESDLPVLQQNRPFSSVSTAFGSDLVGRFEQALRVLRVFSDSPDLDRRLISSFIDGEG
jgi:HD superfamily phosphohydrolase